MRNAAPATFNVAVLGDSRVFDTYYATGDYVGKAYGYDKTFPHQLQRRLIAKTGGACDCVHIPDHFRGRTVQNNILRLSLIDPDCIILCDGIWESLVSKKTVAEFFEQSGIPAVEYSDALATELFLSNKLPLSPESYAERVGRIASWFVRRRRHVIWLTTPVPPEGHLDGLHYAGSYRPFVGWHDCLRAINSAASRIMIRTGGSVLDLDLLMTEFGGAQAALIDQWHFSAGFHAHLAEKLEQIIKPLDGTRQDCVSRSVIVQGMNGSAPLGLLGSDEQRHAFKASLPDCSVVAESALYSDASLDGEMVWVVLDPDTAKRSKIVEKVMAVSKVRPVVVFPEELMGIDNPAVADRSTFGSLK